MRLYIDCKYFCTEFVLILKLTNYIKVYTILVESSKFLFLAGLTWAWLSNSKYVPRGIVIVFNRYY